MPINFFRPRPPRGLSDEGNAEATNISMRSPCAERDEYKDCWLATKAPRPMVSNAGFVPIATETAHFPLSNFPKSDDASIMMFDN